MLEISRDLAMEQVGNRRQWPGDLELIELMNDIVIEGRDQDPRQFLRRSRIGVLVEKLQ